MSGRGSTGGRSKGGTLDEATLSAHSKTCLSLLLARFPQFAPFVQPSEYFDGCWTAEIPWPDNRWGQEGLRVQTWITEYGNYRKEEFRVDLPNWHDHFADWDNTGTSDFVNEALDFVDDFFDERIVLAEKSNLSHVVSVQIVDFDYDPNAVGWEKGIERVRTNSWHGTCDNDWVKE